MLCAKLATRRDGQQFPCGQCTNCKINHRRDWQSRLLLEAASNAYSAFVTLTFRDTGTHQILRRSDVRAFTTSLRKLVPSLRYFAAGEYGTKGGRAHYHVMLFSQTPIPDAFLSDCWPYGSIDIGNVEAASIDYVLGYLLKNKNAILWPVEARYPEFRAFSKGIGKLALPHLLIDGAELPREFKVFGRLWPVGRYLRDRAKKMGFIVSQTKEKQLEEYEAQVMRSMLQNPSLSQDEVTKLYDDFVENKKRKSKELQQKAIRAAYLEAHGHSKKVRHETF